MRSQALLLSLLIPVATSAHAGSVSGVVLDTTGAPLPGVTVSVRDVASGQNVLSITGSDGRYEVTTSSSGAHLVTAVRTGFSEFARTLTLDESKVDLPIRLDLGVLSAEVTVTASRSERESRLVPLHVEVIPRDVIGSQNPTSTGDALALAANVTPVGNGPFGVRPRLRGLDSTRLLVLVDGERLNTARQATERTGAEVGLISADSVERLEIVNGAGTLMYGSDALAGAINIITAQPNLGPARRFIYGASGYYSGNEDGARGTATLGATDPRYAVRIQGGADAFDNYHAGSLGVEDTRPYFASGQLKRADTIDTNFGFNFKAFPEPFNAPYVRTNTEVSNSEASGHFMNGAAMIRLTDRSDLRVRYQRRRAKDIGFPDFANPYFFNATSLPKSNIDRGSLKLERREIKPWLANLSFDAYYQQTERILENRLPIQFPAPTAQSFFPISVFRLDTVSDTKQRVRTPGFDVRAVTVPGRNHVLTTGIMAYEDRSHDDRTSTTTTSLLGAVALGARGPAATVFPAPVVLGAPSVTHPVRVPDASLRNIGFFAQDEWRIRPALSLSAGLRADSYNVTTEATPGYTISPALATARPAIDPATQPDPNGATYSRHALTGDLGLVFNPEGTLAPFVRYGRSYRHANLEEMLFTGPATVATIVPNVKVAPETGDNFDAGVRFHTGRLAGGVYGFLNQYKKFIAQDLVVATAGTSLLAQAINFADVRISGVEMSLDAPIAFRRGVLALNGSAALTRGRITSGTTPLDGSSLANTPADNITPSKVSLSARFTEARGRFWIEYGVRVQGKVSRVAKTLLDSPFLIAQDLLSLQGFTVQRIGGGLHLTKDPHRVDLTVAVENLADVYYREQFQFAPSRGRTLTIGLRTGAF